MGGLGCVSTALMKVAISCTAINACMHAVLILQMALLVPVLMSVVWTGPAHAAKKSRQVREVWLL